MDIRTLLQAYKSIKEAERKQKELDKMASGNFTHTILKDLVNSAAYGVTIKLTFKDGTNMEIVRDEQYDKMKRYVEGF